MKLKFKINVLDELKAAGYSSYRLRNEKILSESTIQKLRGGDMVSVPNIEIICGLLRCDVSDLLELVNE